MERESATLIVFYDDTCGLCQRSRLFFQRWTRRPSPFRFVGIHSTDCSPYLERLGLNTEAMLQSMHVFNTASGRLDVAEDAVAVCLEACIWPWSWVGLCLGLSLLKPLSQPMYQWVARRRHQFLPPL